MTRPNRQLSWSAALFVIAIAGATPAAAQSPFNARVEVSANVGAQTGASTFTASNTLASSGGEAETIAVDHGVKTALGFSVGAAVRLLPQFWVGAQYAMTEMKPSATVTAAIPHPILFDALRTVEGSVNDVARNEQNVHVALMHAAVHAVDVKIMGGPTFFRLKQDFVSGVAISETLSFDTAVSPVRQRLCRGSRGFNALSISLATFVERRYRRTNPAIAVAM